MVFCLGLLWEADGHVGLGGRGLYDRNRINRCGAASHRRVQLPSSREEVWTGNAQGRRRELSGGSVLGREGKEWWVSGRKEENGTIFLGRKV